MHGEMYPIHLNKNKARIIKKASALLVVVMIAAFTVWWLNEDDPVSEQANTASKSGHKPVSENELMKAQEEAAAAAFEANPVTGTVAKRPDFVSELEWQVLQNAVRQQSGKNNNELTRLINKLLFAKKWEAWLASAGDASRRRSLAGQMLAMIPTQVESRSLDPAEAEKMETEFNAELNK